MNWVKSFFAYVFFFVLFIFFLLGFDMPFCTQEFILVIIS